MPWGMHDGGASVPRGACMQGGMHARGVVHGWGGMHGGHAKFWAR